MARLAILQRELKRRKLVEKFSKKRFQLKSIILSDKYDKDEKWSAQIKLQKLTANSSKTRLNNRCRITGRAHGVYRKFGLCRNILRIHAMEGNVPGLKKSSW